MRSEGAAGRWIERYQAGAHREVWHEMTDAGSALRDDPGAWEDATAVARETLRRVRDNIRLLHGTLASAGYRFACGDQALQPPPPDTHERLNEIERVIGPVPLLLKVWMQEVGRVNLTGTLPSWQFEYTDALVVEYWIDDVLDEHRDRARREPEWAAPQEPLPQMLTKLAAEFERF